MKHIKRSLKELQTFEDFEKELFKDPEFRKAAKQTEHEFQLASSLIEMRYKRKLSQAQLAKKVGTKQPVISRLETGIEKPSISLLERIAFALNSSLEVRLKPLVK